MGPERDNQGQVSDSYLNTMLIADLQENIVFGAPFDEARYHKGPF
jgi:hypothetical protein